MIGVQSPAMPELALLERLLRRLAATWPDSLLTVATLALVLVVVLVIERRHGRDTRRYLARGVRTDLAYLLFAVSGLYLALLSGPVVGGVRAAIRHLAPLLELNLLAGLPDPARLALFLLGVDLAGYWKHRWLHSSRTLWAFHSIHHSQEELTIATLYRTHFVEQLINNLVTLGVALLLGVPARIWLPVALLLTAHQALQHSDLGWTFGRLGRLLVSPAFHRLHHSAEPRHFNANYSAGILSVWDTLFRSADATPERPRAYGIRGLTVPESFFRQLVFPFRLLAGRLAAAAGVRPVTTGQR